MGMALHPDFEGHPYVYVMYSYSEDGRQQARIQRLKHLGTHATLDEVVLDGLSALRYHIGGRIAFGPDGMLYIGTGDVERPPVSQDLQSLDGKILRLRPDGQIPKTTPSPTRLSSPMATVWFRGSPGIPKRVCSSTPSTGLPAPKWKGKQDTGIRSIRSSQEGTMDGPRSLGLRVLRSFRIRLSSGRTNRFLPAA